MAKIRILHLIKTLGLGGAETNLLNLARAFNSERIETHVGYSEGGEIEARFRESGVLLFRYARAGHKLKSLATFAIVARLALYVRRHKIDIIHTHNFNAHVWGAFAAKLTGARLVEHVHDFRYMADAEYRRRHGTVDQFRMIKHFKGLADAVCVLTQECADFILRGKFYPASKIRQIPNGIRLESSAADAALLKKCAGLGPADAVILTAARLAEEKNVDLVLEIAPAVLQKHPNACFVVAGDGPLFSSLQDRCRREGLSRVKFVGYQPDITGWLSASEVFLLPSFLELHSIAILEAMIAGVPVLVSEGVGCNSEFIRSWENGVLADPWKPEQWSAALDRLLSERGLGRRIGEAGKTTCLQRFDIRQTARQFESLYEELAR